MFKFTKFVSIILILSLLLVSSPVQAERIVKNSNNAHFGFDGITIENINIDFDDDDLTVKNIDEKTSFTIDHTFELYINN